MSQWLSSTGKLLKLISNLYTNKFWFTFQMERKYRMNNLLITCSAT